MSLLKEIMEYNQKHIGLPKEVISEMHEDHLSFYLAHKDKMDISLGEDGGVEYILNNRKLIFDFSKNVCNVGELVKNVLKGNLVLDEEDIEGYISRRGFSYRFTGEACLMDYLPRPA